MSERGAESRIILTEKEKKDLALARVLIGGWWFVPIRKGDQVVGT